MGRLTNLNPSKALTEADMPPGMATDTEVTVALNAHTSAADPHSQYLIHEIKIIDTLTAASQGGYTTIAHGLNSGNISSVSVMVSWGGNKLSWVPEGYTFNSGRQFSWDIPDASSITIINVAGNSGNILAKPARICIFYTN
jgi:hypothetical protein